MSLILRVDVDKPYGRTTFKDKILSKLREDYCLPAITSAGYLNHVKAFLVYLRENNIAAHIYFRTCTLPPRNWINDKLLNGHLIGLHAENTRSIETFQKELDDVKMYFSPIKLHSFTKHGSGELKLGRNHYPPYEPEKYIKWGEAMGIPFLFGNNELVNGSNRLSEGNHYYSSMYWIERKYPDSKQLDLGRVVEAAKNINVIIITHPANFIASSEIRERFNKLVLLSRQHKIPWITIENK
ncbi:hypothetical protein C4544_05095 [candidate division WS5 bacterium]|uniref:NodB homology domain-containing protein n=1 Tax=candidate division WS5 bacterium TaxID=2093353 RepID=A0A419DBG0_9BACT|nr:MAG: hypothetical protein C4544_05095 [candidate division WS5 bacterium]